MATTGYGLTTTLRRIFLTCVLVALSFPSLAQQAYVPGEIIVGFKAEATPQQIKSFEQANKLTLINDFSGISARHYRLPDGLSVPAAIAQLRSFPGIAYVEANGVLKSICRYRQMAH